MTVLVHLANEDVPWFDHFGHPIASPQKEPAVLNDMALATSSPRDLWTPVVDRLDAADEDADRWMNDIVKDPEIAAARNRIRADHMLSSEVFSPANPTKPLLLDGIESKSKSVPLS